MKNISMKRKVKCNYWLLTLNTVVIFLIIGSIKFLELKGTYSLFNGFKNLFHQYMRDCQKNDLAHIVIGFSQVIFDAFIISIPFIFISFIPALLLTMLLTTVFSKGEQDSQNRVTAKTVSHLRFAVFVFFF